MGTRIRGGHVLQENVFLDYINITGMMCLMEDIFYRNVSTQKPLESDIVTI